MLFDVMTFLYQSIPGMKLMEDLRGGHDAGHGEVLCREPRTPLVISKPPT
jgi:hypothetical protein